MFSQTGSAPFIKRLSELGQQPGECSNSRMQRQTVVIGGVLMSVGGLLWGGLSLGFGLSFAAALPLGYAVATGVNLWCLARGKNFPRARVVQVALSLCLPFLFQWALGGFTHSGGVMLWAMIALVGSLTFSSVRESVVWLVLYCLLTGLTGLLDGAAAARATFTPSEGVRTLFFVLNIVCITSIVFSLAILLNHRQMTAIEALEAGQDTNRALTEQLQAAASSLEAQVRSRTAELQTALIRAEEGTRAKGEFLAVMSHEIRTPLNGILGTTELLELSRLDAEQADLVRLIRRSGEVLLNLLNDVLDFSKIEAGRVELVPRGFDVRAEFDGVVGLHRSRTMERGVRLVAEYAPQVPERLQADPDRLVQVVGNLLSNAVKFTHRGEVRLCVGGRAVGDSFELEVAVVDTGIGIASENLHRLFKPFSQADSSTTRRYGGTGLGLAICARIVEQMGGKIEVSSFVGQGTTFRFRVGCKRSLSSESRHGISEVANASPPETRLKVLLAEDNVVNQAIARKLLQALHCEVTVADDGEAAVDFVTKQTFDLILMDVQMPVLDGLAATRMIRELQVRQPRIVALTANAFEGDKAACLAAGMDDFLAKPLRLVALRAQLEKVSPPALALTG